MWILERRRPTPTNALRQKLEMALFLTEYHADSIWEEGLVRLFVTDCGSISGNGRREVLL